MGLMLPSTPSEGVGALDLDNFGAQYLSPCVPLSTLRRILTEYRRMTRGRCGLLDLQRRALSSPTLCRSPGAFRTGRPRSIPSCNALRAYRDASVKRLSDYW